MSRPKFDKIIEMLSKGENFSLSRAQYIKYTGTDLPQRKSYTEKDSAVAKRAKAYNYKIEVIPERINFIKQ